MKKLRNGVKKYRTSPQWRVLYHPEHKHIIKSAAKREEESISKFLLKAGLERARKLQAEGAA